MIEKETLVLQEDDVETEATKRFYLWKKNLREKFIHLVIEQIRRFRATEFDVFTLVSKSATIKASRQTSQHVTLHLKLYAGQINSILILFSEMISSEEYQTVDSSYLDEIIRKCQEIESDLTRYNKEFLQDELSNSKSKARTREDEVQELLTFINDFPAVVLSQGDSQKSISDATAKIQSKLQEISGHCQQSGVIQGELMFVGDMRNILTTIHDMSRRVLDKRLVSVNRSLGAAEKSSGSGTQDSWLSSQRSGYTSGVSDTDSYLPFKVEETGMVAESNLNDAINPDMSQKGKLTIECTADTDEEEAIETAIGRRNLSLRKGLAQADKNEELESEKRAHEKHDLSEIAKADTPLIKEACTTDIAKGTSTQRSSIAGHGKKAKPQHDHIIIKKGVLLSQTKTKPTAERNTSEETIERVGKDDKVNIGKKGKGKLQALSKSQSIYDEIWDVCRTGIPSFDEKWRRKKGSLFKECKSDTCLPSASGKYALSADFAVIHDVRVQGKKDAPMKREVEIKDRDLESSRTSAKPTTQVGVNLEFNKSGLLTENYLKDVKADLKSAKIKDALISKYPLMRNPRLIPSSKRSWNIETCSDDVEVSDGDSMEQLNAENVSQYDIPGEYEDRVKSKEVERQHKSEKRIKVEPDTPNIAFKVKVRDKDKQEYFRPVSTEMTPSTCSEEEVGSLSLASSGNTKFTDVQKSTQMSTVAGRVINNDTSSDEIDMSTRESLDSQIGKYMQKEYDDRISEDIKIHHIDSRTVAKKTDENVNSGISQSHSEGRMKTNEKPEEEVDTKSRKRMHQLLIGYQTLKKFRPKPRVKTSLNTETRSDDIETSAEEDLEQLNTENFSEYDIPEEYDDRVSGQSNQYQAENMNEKTKLAVLVRKITDSGTSKTRGYLRVDEMGKGGIVKMESNHWNIDEPSTPAMKMDTCSEEVDMSTVESLDDLNGSYYSLCDIPEEYEDRIYEETTKNKILESHFDQESNIVNAPVREIMLCHKTTQTLENYDPCYNPYITKDQSEIKIHGETPSICCYCHGKPPHRCSRKGKKFVTFSEDIDCYIPDTLDELNSANFSSSDIPEEYEDRVNENGMSPSNVYQRGEAGRQRKQVSFSEEISYVDNGDTGSYDDRIASQGSEIPAGNRTSKLDVDRSAVDIYCCWHMRNHRSCYCIQGHDKSKGEVAGKFETCSEDIEIGSKDSLKELNEKYFSYCDIPDEYVDRINIEEVADSYQTANDAETGGSEIGITKTDSASQRQDDSVKRDVRSVHTSRPEEDIEISYDNELDDMEEENIHYLNQSYYSTYDIPEDFEDREEITRRKQRSSLEFAKSVVEQVKTSKGNLTDRSVAPFRPLVDLYSSVIEMKKMIQSRRKAAIKSHDASVSMESEADQKTDSLISNENIKQENVETEQKRDVIQECKSDGSLYSDALGTDTSSTSLDLSSWKSLSSSSLDCFSAESSLHNSSTELFNSSSSSSVGSQDGSHVVRASSEFFDVADDEERTDYKEDISTVEPVATAPDNTLPIFFNKSHTFSISSSCSARNVYRDNFLRGIRLSKSDFSLYRKPDRASVIEVGDSVTQTSETKVDFKLNDQDTYSKNVTTSVCLPFVLVFIIIFAITTFLCLFELPPEYGLCFSKFLHYRYIGGPVL